MMMRRIAYTLFLTVLTFIRGTAQPQPANEAVNAYVTTYRDLAIREMQRTGVPASIKLAQGILETEAGKSELVQKSNNHFGIKCKTSWNGEKVYHDDDARGECFRKYASPEDSYADHSNYLKNTERYAFLFQLDPTDYKGWAYGLKKAGYATNPKYSQMLIRYIEQYNLNDYTLIALGRKTPDYMVSSAATEGADGKGKNGSPFLENISISTGQGSANADLSSQSPIIPEPPKPQYPDGEFSINNTRVIYAKSGTSLLSVAELYNVRFNWLLDFNEIPKGEEVITGDQLIFLQRKRKQGPTEYHIMEEGEDLYSISQKEGIRLESLLKFNQLSVDMKPSAGEKIYLQQKAPERPKLSYTGK